MQRNSFEELKKASSSVQLECRIIIAKSEMLSLYMSKASSLIVELLKIWEKSYILLLERSNLLVNVIEPLKPIFSSQQQDKNVVSFMVLQTLQHQLSKISNVRTDVKMSAKLLAKENKLLQKKLSKYENLEIVLSQRKVTIKNSKKYSTVIGMLFSSTNYQQCLEDAHLVLSLDQVVVKGCC